MAKTPITLLLLRRVALTTKTPKPPLSNCFISHKPYSSSPLPDPPNPSSLSARMSFVFDQIDAIERERADKDKTLQRIRAWRQSKNTQQQQQQQQQNQDGTIVTQQTLEGFRQNPEVICSKDEELESGVNGNNLNLTESDSVGLNQKGGKDVELVHPWPEWIELMERLVKQNYFDNRRKDEDKMLKDLGFDTSQVGAGNGDNSFDFGVDFFKDFKTVQTACLNFGKDRFDILRSLSRQDIQILTGYGCPSADKKVVFSSKLLRKHAHLDEGDVCSNCSLRNSCQRAFLLPNKEEEARTIDVMRVLHTYGFDSINESVTNKPLMKKKSVKTVVRKLLHEVVKLSAVPIDPNLPPPIIKKPPPKVKQPPPPPKKRVGRDDVEMKKGDWLCPKCDFMNFAKNTVCLQCDAKRPKRQLLPGEWECPQCNFLNYRRNTACFHCDCKRPPDEYMESKMDEGHRSHKTRLEKISRREDVPNAWNFDFDDDESDGADVAAFEYADTASERVNSQFSNRFEEENFRGHDNGHGGSRNRVDRQRDYSDDETNRPGIGFDDFDDFDDVDSYELDTHSHSSVHKNSRGDSFDKKKPSLQDFEDSDDDLYTDLANSRSLKNPSKSKYQKASSPMSEDEELDFGSDREIAVHPQWKSSHVAGARNKIRGRGPTKGLSFGSDEDLDIHSDEDDFGSGNRKEKRKSMGVSRKSTRRSSDWDDFDDDDMPIRDNGSRRNQGSRKRVDKFRRHGDFDEFDSESRGRNKRSQRNDRLGYKMNDRGSDRRSFGGRDREGFQTGERGRSRDHNRDMYKDLGEFRNSRRVIER